MSFYDLGCPFSGDFVFYGQSGVECEDFIIAVRRLARKFNKGNDPAWIAEMIWVCFEEDALQWHISLDNDVRQDWTQLEKALIQRFPPPENRESRFLTR